MRQRTKRKTRTKRKQWGQRLEDAEKWGNREVGGRETNRTRREMRGTAQGWRLGQGKWDVSGQRETGRAKQKAETGSCVSWVHRGVL